MATRFFNLHLIQCVNGADPLDQFVPDSSTLQHVLSQLMGLGKAHVDFRSRLRRSLSINLGVAQNFFSGGNILRQPFFCRSL